ncbi:hypothetical protein C2869_00175 [Saccharobesus litoralis]|uniref:Uncharacterized protein n=1 Tax=Saccharobesus litoralis TaxID=2172099 RepID=A0A2S0VL72_9ALTE|nr:hypothetical protein [Saccharobesus litoralis]AWB64951.1 hypothetical protein C2869_00175 [Saccharobesus litoralis]
MSDAYTPPQSELITENNNSFKLYKVVSIAVATFFGSSIAGGYLMSQNFRRLGRDTEAQYSLYGGIALTLLLFVISFLLPDNVSGSTLTTIIPTIIMQQIAKHRLQNDLDTHIAANGELESGWKAFGISLLFLAIIALITFGIAITAASLGWI